MEVARQVGDRPIERVDAQDPNAVKVRFISCFNSSWEQVQAPSIELSIENVYSLKLDTGHNEAQQRPCSQTGDQAKSHIASCGFPFFLLNPFRYRYHAIRPNVTIR